MDYDSDGRLDFLTGSISGKVYLYRRKPNGAFLEPEVLLQQTRGLLGSGRTALNVGSPSAVAMADWFGSGKLDLFVGNGEGHVYVFRNQGTRQKPVFKDSERLKAGDRTIVADGGYAGPFVADWDGDGKLDLVVGCGSGRVVWYRNIGSAGHPVLAEGITLVDPLPANFARDKELLRNPNRSGQNAKVCVCDWNGDGLPDLVVGDYWNVGGKAHGWVWVYLRKPAEAAQAR